MKITDVKATTLKGFKQWNYVLIETDEGLTGLGEAHPGLGVADFVLKQFKPMLVGKDPRDVEPLYNRFSGIPPVPVNNEPDVKTGPPHVGADHVGMPKDVRDIFCGDDSTARP